MWSGGDPRVADEPEDLSSLHPVTDAHADARGLHVGVERVAVPAQMLHHTVAGHVVERGERRLDRRRVLGDVVAHRDDRAGRRGVDRGAVDGVALVALRITVEEAVGCSVESGEVDREALRMRETAVDRHRGMGDEVQQAVASQRWAEGEGRSVLDRRACAGEAQSLVRADVGLQGEHEPVRQLGRRPTAWQGDVQEQHEGLPGADLGLRDERQAAGSEQPPDRRGPERRQGGAVLVGDDEPLEDGARRRRVVQQDLVDQVPAMVGPHHRRRGGEDIGRRSRLRAR